MATRPPASTGPDTVHAELMESAGPMIGKMGVVIPAECDLAHRFAGGVLPFGDVNAVLVLVDVYR